MNEDVQANQIGHKESYIYCIRCGKMLCIGEAYYSKYVPDCEESMCRKCYKRYEKLIESEDKKCLQMLKPCSMSGKSLGMA